MDIRLHQLEGFHYTGLENGFARAAAAMPYPISEPAVYQQVRKLERALGVSLVVRAGPRRMVLTPAGRTLHAFAAPFFQGLPALADGLRRGDAARLVIAIEGAPGRDAVLSALPGLRRRVRGLEVHLAEREADEVARMVRAGDADVGLGTLVPGAAGLRQESLFRLRVALCVPRGHALAGSRPPSRAALDGVPLCVYERGQPGRDVIEDAYARAGISLRIAAEAGSAETLRALVAAGVGPAFVPVVAPPPRRGSTRDAPRAAKSRRAWHTGSMVVFDVTALVPSEPVRYGLLSRAGAPLPPPAAELRRALVEASKE